MKLLQMIPALCIYVITNMFIGFCTGLGMYHLLSVLTVLSKETDMILALFTSVYVHVYISFSHRLVNIINANVFKK